MGTTEEIFKGMFEVMEEKAATSIRINDGDYQVDGLWYCGKCNTQKQCLVEVFGSVRTPFCLCKCEAERKKQEKADFERRQTMLTVKIMREAGFLDEDMRNWTFANDDHANEKLSTIARNYVEHFEEMKQDGKGLLLYGGVGTGKTYISACIANALIDKEHPCLVTNFARLVNTIQGMYDGRQAYIDGLNKYHLLVIDDLASERDTEYMNEVVQMIIDARTRAGLPIIITTNLTAAELKNPADMRKQRIYSRLFEMCIPIHVEGEDRRRNKLKEGYDNYKDLLGL